MSPSKSGSGRASVWTVAALYKFAPLPDYRALREPLYDLCEMLGICGTLLLAEEGINGTVAGSESAIADLIGFLQADPRLNDLEVKYSTASEKPFIRLKVRLKKEIVTLGVEGIDPNERVGTYVDPADWNALISDPDVTLIDTRNDYEVALGTFEGALDPKTESFREFPDWVETHRDAIKTPKVAMFCTGGIRCEKASAWMLENGYDEVYHLKGGILKYLETQAEEESLWNGDCFVFDQRVAVGHGLEESGLQSCYGCRMPLTPDDLRSNAYEAGVSCPHCIEDLSPERKARFRERQHQITRASQRGEIHLGRKF
jgi:UPF0176 protein